MAELRVRVEQEAADRLQGIQAGSGAHLGDLRFVESLERCRIGVRRLCTRTRALKRLNDYHPTSISPPETRNPESGT
jgi:hypothetical protein